MKIQLIAATAAFALMGGAAMAQDKSMTMDQPMATPPPATDSMAQPMTPPATDASTTTAVTTDTSTGAMTATTATTDNATGASVTTSMVTNGPVPDTAANRAKYGSPMSNAGKRTKAVGN